MSESETAEVKQFRESMDNRLLTVIEKKGQYIKM